MNDGEVSIIWSMFPDKESAGSAARLLVEERLVACATVLASAQSHFRWQGGLQQADEVPLLCKASTDLAVRASERLRTLHPYDLPVVVCWSAQCDAAVAAWAGAA